MNNRNYTDSTPHVPAEKLRRAGLKTGKAQLLDHTRITISLSHATVRRHPVRAHPRVMAKGVTRIRANSWGSLETGVIERQTRQIRP
jgi:hypothetical protein